MKKVFTTAFIAMLSLSAFAQTKADTLVVTTTPSMHCKGCENGVRGTGSSGPICHIANVINPTPVRLITLTYNDN